MNLLDSRVDGRGAWQAAEAEAVGLLAGAGFTFALFFALAHFDRFDAAEPVAAIEDMRMVAIPFEPPPPPPRLAQPAPVPEAAVPFAGIEVGASNSPVSIAVVPPDMETMFPATTSQPGARIQFNALYTELRPRVDFEVDARHVYQETEVDQQPQALVRTVPPVPPDVAGRAPTLRVRLLLLIGQNGKVESARVVESSGNPRFDEIVSHTVVNEWLFSPAIRRGKKVRVMAQQAFRLTFSNGTSPFTTN